MLLAALACNFPGKVTSPSDAGAGLTPMPVAAWAAIQTKPAPSEPRIAIRTVNGVAEFYDRQTGAKFVPRGATLWRWRWLNQDQQGVIDTIFNTSAFGQLDSALEELPRMRADGFNTVRLWFNACYGDATGCIDLAAGGLNQGFLQNMARFLQVAKDNGIYVILTMDSLPDSSQYQALMNPYRGKFESFNLEFMTQGGVDA